MDVLAMQKAINFRRVTKMTALMPYPYVLSDAVFWIRKTQRYFRQRPLQHIHLAITHQAKVIGAIGVDRDGDQAEIGFWLTPAVHGQGMMTEVVRAFVPFVFRMWPVQRLIAKTFLFNPASARVLEKSGFERTALEASAILKDGKWLDVLVFTHHKKTRS